MVAKVLTVGYYWTTVQRDCAKFLKNRAKCQEFGPLNHLKPEELPSMTSPWSLSIWVMDIIDPFAPGKWQTKFLLVGVDYFTKRIEAEPLTSISEKKCAKFVWRIIVCRFRVSHTIITDNGRHFIN